MYGSRLNKRVIFFGTIHILSNQLKFKFLICPISRTICPNYPLSWPYCLWFQIKWACLSYVFGRFIFCQTKRDSRLRKILYFIRSVGQLKYIEPSVAHKLYLRSLGTFLVKLQDMRSVGQFWMLISRYCTNYNFWTPASARVFLSALLRRPGQKVSQNNTLDIWQDTIVHCPGVKYSS